MDPTGSGGDGGAAGSFALALSSSTNPAEVRGLQAQIEELKKQLRRERGEKELGDQERQTIQSERDICLSRMDHLQAENDRLLTIVFRQAPSADHLGVSRTTADHLGIAAEGSSRSNNSRDGVSSSLREVPLPARLWHATNAPLTES